MCGDRDKMNNAIISKLSQREYKTRHDWVGEVIHWEIYKKFKFDHMNKWYRHNPESILENEMHKLLRDFEIQTDHQISARWLDLQQQWQQQQQQEKSKKKRTCQIVDFAVPADHRVKLKESEKKDKYLDLARELSKLWNVRVTVTPIVIYALDTVTKGLVQGQEKLELRERVETSQTTALLRSSTILKRVLETWWDLLSLRFQWKIIG